MADAADLKSDVERRVGSNPTGGTIDILQAPLAQLVEQETFNLKVMGSRPIGRTIDISG